MSSSTEESAPADSTPATASPPLSKLAIAALATGVLPLVPAAIGLGIAGLVVTRAGRRRGRGLAIGGLLGATTWIAVGVTLGTVATLTHGFHKPVKIEYNYSHAAVFGLRQGNCIITPNESVVSAVSCTSPHDAEVFATFTLPAGPWPGSAAVEQAADDGCGARLSGYLNPQLAISLSQDYVYPGQVAWQAGTRTVVCEVRAASGQLDQSVRGAP
jgi:hypothetical protein